MDSQHEKYVPNAADADFQPPEFLYKIILVCMFFGFILFLIFFALARFLKYQNRCRAMLIAQQEKLEREQALLAEIDGNIVHYNRAKDCGEKDHEETVPLSPQVCTIDECECKLQKEQQF